MKRTILKLLCVTFCLVLSMNVFAETTAVVGGLKYSFQGNKATVIGYENLNLSGGILEIPETVEWNGLSFDVSEIGNSAFYSCNQIIKLIIKYQNVGEDAFKSCENLEYVDITGGSVGKRAFRLCTKLKDVKISSYSYIGSFAFNGCTSLESVSLNWIYDIYDDAFSNCTNLKWIDFGNNLKRIGSNAFGNCKSLTYVVFPETLEQICLNNPSKSSGRWVSSEGSYYYYYPYDCWGTQSFEAYFYDTSTHNGFPSDHPLISTKAAFTGCDLIQSVIYLGDWCSNGLSNVNYYYAQYSDFVTWSSTQFTYTGSVPSPNITCNLPAGFQLANDFTMPVLDKNVGTYETTIPMTFSNGHQSFTADIPYKYTIAPLSLKARVKNATREYGEVNPEFQTEYSGFIIGEDESVLTSKGTYSTTAYANSDVGKYTVTQSGATAQNYTIEYEPGTLTVTKAPLTVTARSKTMTYGDRMPTLEVDYAGLKNNESKPAWITDPDIMTTGTSSSNVGTYPITVRGGEAKNYNVTYKQGTLTINKASLTATTQDAIREYGDEDPEFEMTYSGLKNNESAPVWRVTPTIVTATSKSSPVGTYDITATGGDARNYQVQYVNTGKLTVTKAPLTAIARSYTKKQGEPNPVFAVDYEGFKNGETKLALTQEPVAVTSAQQNSRPGTYPITLSDGIAMNYDFTYVDGTLTILPSDNPQEETENVLTLNGLTANRGAQVTLPIGMTNKKSITGVQFDLYLPVGVTVATNSKGKLMVTTTSRMDGNYSITGSDMGDFVRIVGYSADSDPFTGTSGDILNVTLNIGNDVADGNYTVRLKDIVLSDVNNTEHHPADVGGVITVKSYTLGDVDNSGAVNINDVVCIINHILNRTTGTFIEEAADVDGSGVININDVVSLINRFILHRNNAPKKVSGGTVVTEAGKDWLYLDNFVITAGETKEIAVMMKNANEVKAVQGNIKLPEGISFVTKSNGRLDVTNLNDRSEDFTLSCALQEDGSMTFAQYSADGFAYDGNEGGIFTFKVKADDNAPKGNFDIIMTDIVMSIDGVAFEAPDYTSQIEINSTFDPEHPEYTTIAAVKNAANAQKVSVVFKANDLLVTFVIGSYVYVYDGTDGLLLFGANSGITAGDKITADIKGQLYLYKGMTEIDVNAYENLTINSSNNAVVPQKVTIADLYNKEKDYENELVQFEGLYAQADALSYRNIEFFDSNENVLVVWDKYNVLTNTTFSLEDTYSVVGFVGINTQYSEPRTEIYPRTAEDVSNGDIQEPYEFAGDGTYENPYTVADIQHKYATSNRTPVESDVWVKAYIVGYISGSSLSVSNVIFSADAPGGTDKDGNPLTVSVSNILVADKANTKSVAEVIPIGLVNYSTARTDLNLADNPTRLGQLVWLKGDILKYFGVTGLKNVQLYSDGVTPIVTSINNVSAIDPDGAMIFDATGKRLSKLQRGVNIIRMSDGTVKKVLVK